ncbi:MAG: cytidylate kinase-like family protein [Candidatus Eremiobacteraeota bacterium]|nr:cytidylate kinase-like family protein [Candidatus Eremiobacteraeota bacterium]
MIVTISNQYGSGAIAVAELAARELGYEFVDRQLPVVVAKRMRISPEEASAADEMGRSLGSRVLSSMELATPELATTSLRPTFDDEYIREVQAAVREYASHGNVLIVGRGAGVILGRRPDVLRVFMHAPREWRIERVMEDFSLQRRAATVEVDRVDRARDAHLRDWYGAELGSPEIYDLSIDTSAFGARHSAELIVSAVRCRS